MYATGFSNSKFKQNSAYHPKGWELRAANRIFQHFKWPPPFLYTSLPRGSQRQNAGCKGLIVRQSCPSQVAMLLENPLGSQRGAFSLVCDPCFKTSSCFMTPMFSAALFTIARTWTRARCPPADEQLRRLWHASTMAQCSAIKRHASESILPRWMKLEPVLQTGVSQKEKHKDYILMHVYGLQKGRNNGATCRARTTRIRTGFRTPWEKASVGRSERAALRRACHHM